MACGEKPAYCVITVWSRVRSAGQDKVVNGKRVLRTVHIAELYGRIPHDARARILQTLTSTRRHMSSSESGSTNMTRKSPDVLEQLYDTWHQKQGVDLELNSPWHALAIKYLGSSRDIDGRKVLEIGCGRGEFACWLSSLPRPPREVVAADFSCAALEKGQAVAKERGLRNISWEKADIQALPFANNHFDTVISCETIEHVPNPRLAIRELARVLKPGGRLILTTPNYFGSFGLYRIYLRCVGRRYTELGQPINHFVMLPLTLLWTMQSGLRIRVIDSVGIPLFLPGRAPVELKLPRKLCWFWRWFGLQSCTVAEKPA